MGSVPGLGGGLAVVMRPPASRRIAMPAATSLWSVSQSVSRRIIRCVPETSEDKAEGEISEVEDLKGKEGWRRECGGKVMK